MSKDYNPVNTSSTWRELLGKVIQDTQERQRVAHELGVSTVTLLRWVHDASNPRQHNLYRLLEALPQYRMQFLELFRAEFSSFSNAMIEEAQEDVQDVIPSTFYAQIFSIYATTPLMQRFWTISNLILQQALKQLDPQQLGLAVMVVQCMPPWDDASVYSLREKIGYGTTPWNTNLEQYAIFLGAESLAGNVVGSGRYLVLQSRDEYHGIAPAQWVEWEQSAAAYPLLRSNKIAGCLLVSSTQMGYFTAERMRLLEHYAELLSFAFEPHEFHDLQHIHLRTMPHYDIQKKYLTSFRQRVARIMAASLDSKQQLSLTQAEQIIWQQLERELLANPS